MNISYNWLKEYLKFDWTPAQLSDALTSIGLETGGIEEVETIKGGLKGLVIGHVLTCIDHPNSDHLHVTTVDLGSGEPQQIVCGAPNVAAGQKVVVATIGTTLYSGNESFTIKKSKIRGARTGIWGVRQTSRHCFWLPSKSRSNSIPQKRPLPLCQTPS